MKIESVKKRDGRILPYSWDKIAESVALAMNDAQLSPAKVATASKEIADIVQANLCASVTSDFEGSAEVSAVQIEQTVKAALKDGGFDDALGKYTAFRADRTNTREMDSELMRTFDELTHADSAESNLKRDNANINGDTAMGTMLQYGSEAAKDYYEKYMLPKEQAKAYHDGYIHIHDFDFYALTTTCCQIEISSLFKDGFSTGHGFLREPNSIQSYAALTCIAIQSNQNDQHGGQAIVDFDRGLAPGVAKSYKNYYTTNLFRALELRSCEGRNSDKTAFENLGRGKEAKYTSAPALDALKEMDRFIEWENGVKRQLKTDSKFLALEKKALMEAGFEESTIEDAQKFAVREAERETERATYQAMEALIHNLNTMHSRAGAQTPFSSVNYGTDTSAEGRMVIRNMLNATDAGLGMGETPIFPIQIFRVKDGVNYNEGDPNYDLFIRACEVSAKRLFPNFSFIDAPFNLQYYKSGHPETEIAYMGCRTRVMSNIHDPSHQTAPRRGNLSFTSINLPRLAIESNGDEEVFYKKLDDMLNLVIQQLLDRFKIQSAKRVYNFPFLMGQGVWLGSENLGPTDTVGEVLKHGSLSVGFIGLAETLVALYGHHHGESDEMQQKGLAIISYMRKRLDAESQKRKLNFALIATPAEGLSGRFVRLDKKKYGIIKGVTDRDYYTNSFHIPVYFPISAFDKIKKEAPYHELTNGGHITYVELDGDTANNVEAFESIIRCMHDAGIGYGSINHPVDRDPVCGYVGVIGDVCPRCGRREGEAISAQKLSELRKRFPVNMARYF